ncbi:hypothetical protein XBJ2_1860039 [Xenorhabdus bovienii str. Jollieti]|nr:hypothetical protein [Xenorhabdus bovienii]CDH28536.1 hypothetical protein XBJ2_1860039 [Xenorhabdus bovienii str. Jollieti]
MAAKKIYDMAENRESLDPDGWFSPYLKNRGNYVFSLFFRYQLYD